MGDFELFVKRASNDVVAYAAPVAGAQPAEVAQPPQPASQAFDSTYDSGDELDEAHIYITSPKVGTFRRGNYVKGRQIGTKPVAEVRQEVKKGQPVGFIEQLGSFVPVEAPQAGEITAFMAEEGEAVEYKQVITEVAPFFGGHIIGDSKYA